MMASAKRLCVFAIACLTAVSAFSISYTPHSRGRKLFGGYRIVPKVCQPTNPARTKSTEPAICMFNYECTRRNGEVVGACMDGFLFGACCQLPAKDIAAPSIQANSAPSPEQPVNLHEIDHVPDMPILLNPDGTPVGMTYARPSSTTKIDLLSSANDLGNSLGGYTKVSTFHADRSTPRPSWHHKDSLENAEKPQLQNQQPDLSHIEADFPALLGQQIVLDDLRLPGLISHMNDIHEHQEPEAVNPVTTLLRPDQILQIADPVDQLPSLFAQGLGQSNHSGVDTMLLNENGTYLSEANNPDEIFRPGTNASVTGDHKIQGKPSLKPSTLLVPGSSRPESSTPMVQQYANTNRITGTSFGLRQTSATPAYTESRTPTRMTIPQSVSQKASPSSKTTMLRIEATTPMTSIHDYSDDKDDFVRVPTITYDFQSGNKKNDELDREEIAINHIISILNATTPSSAPPGYTEQMSHGSSSSSSSSIHTWTTVDKASTTTETFPYTFYKPGRPSTYYHYDGSSTTASGDGSSSYSTSGSSGSPGFSGSSGFYTSRKPTGTSGSYGSSAGYDYSTRPSTNPPAPTVIVLGPLGTEYTAVTTQKPASRRPTAGSIRPSVVTKGPSIGTTITHNISTVISTGSAVTSNNHVVSSSYISVNLKDNTSPKPSDAIFHQDVVVTSSDDTKTTPVVTKRPSTVWTTLSSWSDKPSFHLKPSQPDFHWPTERPSQTLVFKKTTVMNGPATAAATTTTTTTTLVQEATTAATVGDEETPVPDNLINFPPVRNPNLTQQEKPTLVLTFNDTETPPEINENEIPTPSFIEDDVLTNKVDVFVNKIVQSLQGNFQDLKDVVYAKRNVTATTLTSGTSGTTKRPPTRKPTKTSQSTRRPTTKKPTRPGGITQKPGGQTAGKPAKPTTFRPRPTSVSPTTKRPQTVPSKRKPTRKPTTTTTSTTTTTVAPEAVLEDAEEPVDESADVSTEVQDASQSRECGVRPLLKSGRIVGGKGATFGEWPWQVLVREATWLGLFTKNKCGGVLITNNYVITAAHCQPGFLATLVAVLGEFDLSGELESKRSVTRNVRRVIVNHGYNAATFENDLALLELEKPVQFDAHIVPICMPDDGADFTGRMATVTGWGRVKYNGVTPSVLQEVQVPIMENAVCQEMFRTAGHSKLILDSFLCAGYASGQKDSCEGDSGGPLMMEGPDGRWFLVGTVSHGIKCAAPYLPGVYMRTTFFKPWLHSVTGV